jgi:hypothetical protein
VARRILPARGNTRRLLRTRVRAQSVRGRGRRARDMARYATTTRQIALACAKSHWYGARNPKAQYQFEIAVDLVLSDRAVSGPLTRPMCAGPGDGAAAVLMCSGEMLRALPTATRRRALALTASVLSSGRRRTIGEPGATAAAAAKAYRMAGVDPRRVDVAELHDCTSFAEIGADRAARGIRFLLRRRGRSLRRGRRSGTGRTDSGEHLPAASSRKAIRSAPQACR